jgi:phosphatidylglycerophosphate synthase
VFDTYLRDLKDRLGEPLARRLQAVPPVWITACALAAGLLAAWIAGRGAYLWALGLWLLNRSLDGLDGLLARLHHRQSDFGGYLDILTDFTVYAALPIGLVVSAATPVRYLALALMLAVFYVNTASWMYLAAILEKRRARQPGVATTIVMPAGLIGGFETILAYCLFLLFPARLAPLYLIFSALVTITIVQRLVWAWRELR